MIAQSAKKSVFSGILMLVVLAAAPKGSAATTPTPATAPAPTFAFEPPFGLEAAVHELASLRKPLDKAPNDRVLLGRALVAYLALTFDGACADKDGCDPWLSRAREVAALRVSAGGGPETFLDSAPDILLLIAQRDMMGAKRELDRFPKATEDPVYRACLALATRDWRPLLARERRSLIEDYALVRAWSETGCARMLAQESDSVPSSLTNAFDCALLETDETLLGRDEGAAAVRHVLHDVGVVLNSTEIDAARMTSIARMLGAKIPDKADRAAALAAICARLHDADPDDGSLIGATVRLLSELEHAKSGVVDKDGKHLLIGLGDLAGWLRRRFEMMEYLRVTEIIQDYNAASLPRRRVATLFEGLRVTAPDEALTSLLMGARQLMLMDPLQMMEAQAQNPQASDHERALWQGQVDRERAERARARPYLERLANRLADEHGCAEHSLRFLHNTYGLYLNQDVEPPPALIRALITGSIINGSPPRSGQLWMDFHPDILPVEMRSETRQALIHDPWSWRLRLRGDRAIRIMLSPESSPVFATSVDEKLDTPALVDGKWPGLPIGEWFCLRWDGAIKLDNPTCLGIEANDGADLHVDGEPLVRNSRNPGPNLVGCADPLPAGDHMICVKYFQMGGTACCRLVMGAPGAWETVPATMLSHAGQPGLLRTAYKYTAYNDSSAENRAAHRTGMDAPWLVAPVAILAKDAVARAEVAEKLGNVESKASEATAAVKLLESLPREVWCESGIGVRLGRAFELLGRFDQAETCYRWMTTHECDSSERTKASTYLSGIQEHLGREEDAEATLKEHAKDSPQALEEYGFYLKRHGRWKEAHDCFAQGAGSFGTYDSDSWAVMCALRENPPVWSEAETFLEHGWGTKNALEAIIEIASRYAGHAKREDVVKKLEALEKRGNGAGNCAMRAVLLMRLGRFPDAIPQLDAAVDEWPHNWDALRILFLDVALRTWTGAKPLPAADVARELGKVHESSALRAALQAASDGNWAPVDKLVETTTPGAPEILLLRAMDHAARGMHDDAKKALTQLLTDYPDDPGAQPGRALTAWYAEQTLESLKRAHRPSPPAGKPKHESMDTSDF